MAYFPLFVDLSAKSVLVVGCGTIAERRIASLIPFVARITVIAPVFSSEIQVLSNANRLTLHKGTVTIDKLPALIGNQYDIVLAVTDQPKLNSKIARYCHAHQILVNNCSDQTQCDFFFPALVCTEDITVGICGTGADHKKVRQTAAVIRRQLTSR